MKHVFFTLENNEQFDILQNDVLSNTVKYQLFVGKDNI